MWPSPAAIPPVGFRPASSWHFLNSIALDDFKASVAQAFVGNFLQPPPDARCCGFKEIRHTHDDMKDGEFLSYMAFLKHYFPGAQVLSSTNVRNPADAARSAWWAQRPDDESLLTRARERLAAFAQHNPEDALLFDYDAAEGLFRFLGEPYSPNMLHLVRRKELA